MATNCGRISAGVTRNCESPLVGGVSHELILINKEDIVSYTENVSNSQIITGINLVSSPQAVAYKFEGFKNSVEPQVDLAPAAFLNAWKHQILFRIFDNSPTTKAIIDGMANSTLVAIIKNNNQGAAGNAVYELFGRFSGLEMTVATASKNDPDTQGAYVLTLATADSEKEPKLPATVFDTDLVTTAALIQSLL